MTWAADWCERAKRRAARYAANLVEPDMIVGLGAGSTAACAIEAIGERVSGGELRGVQCVASSPAAALLARSAGLRVIALADARVVDLTIDGADEVDPRLSLLKGAGGALLHERIVGQASRREVIVVDRSKLSPVLGMRAPVAVEVFPIAWRAEREFLAALGARATLRTSRGELVFTEEGNLLLDARFPPVRDPGAVSRALDARAGIAAHGVFVDVATDLVIGGTDGVEHLRAGALQASGGCARAEGRTECRSR